ncbi:MAG TPA: hypothetical protein VG389_26440 [Myxococcota bacterium]|jgi:hypothetical protein|nr:hypothetical protein [Myxococcota bacterium]
MWRARPADAVAAAVLGAVLALAAAGGAGCLAPAPKATEVRGVGHGVILFPLIRAPSLTPAGATVRVAEGTPPPGCVLIGVVTGAAGRDDPRPVGLSRAEAEAWLPRDAALADARNLASAHGAQVLVVDAHAVMELNRPSESTSWADAFRMSYYLVYARAFRCAAP